MTEEPIQTLPIQQDNKAETTSSALPLAPWLSGSTPGNQPSEMSLSQDALPLAPWVVQSDAVTVKRQADKFNAGDTSESEWIGPAPKVDISLLKGGIEYTRLMEANKRGRAGLESAAPSVSDIPFIGDLYDAGSMIKIMRVIDRVNKGKDVSDQDVLDLNLYLAKQERESNANIAGQAANITKGSLKFFAEIGTMLVADLVVGVPLLPDATIAATAGKLLLKGGMKPFKKAIASSVEEYITKKMGKEAIASVAGKAAAVVAPPALIGAELATVNVPGLVKATAEQQLASKLTDEEESLAGSVFDAWVSQVTEYATEFMGADLMLGAKKIAGKMMPSVIPKLVTKLDNGQRVLSPIGERVLGKVKMAQYVNHLMEKYGFSMDKAVQWAGRLGINGWIEEGMEERAGGFFRGLFGVEPGDRDMGLGNAIDKAIPSFEQGVAELAAFALIPLSFAAIRKMTMPLNKDGVTDKARAESPVVMETEQVGKLFEALKHKAEKEDESKEPLDITTVAPKSDVVQDTAIGDEVVTIDGERGVIESINEDGTRTIALKSGGAVIADKSQITKLTTNIEEIVNDSETKGGIPSPEREEGQEGPPKEPGGTIPDELAGEKKIAPSGILETSQRIRLKSTPAIHTIIEQLPPDKGDLPGEIFYKVRNELTGKEEVIGNNDIKALVKPKEVTYKLNKRNSPSFPIVFKYFKTEVDAVKHGQSIASDPKAIDRLGKDLAKLDKWTTRISQYISQYDVKPSDKLVEQMAQAQFTRTALGFAKGELTEADMKGIPKSTENVKSGGKSVETEAEKPVELMTPEEYEKKRTPWPDYVTAGLDYEERYSTRHATNSKGNWIPELDANENPDRLIPTWGRTYRDTVNKAHEWLDAHPEARGHEGIIEDAISVGKPVSASAVDAYGYKLPEGYVREGDRYVFKPSSPVQKPPDLEGGEKANQTESEFIKANWKSVETSQEATKQRKSLKYSYKKLKIDAKAKLNLDDVDIRESRPVTAKRITGISKQSVLSAISDIVKGWKNRITASIYVVDTISEIEGLSDDLRSKLEENRPAGFYDIRNQRIILVASNIKNPRQAIKTLLHEAVGHYGIREVLGEEFSAELDRLSEVIGKEDLEDVASWYGLDLSDQAQRRQATEEFIASKSDPTLYAKIVSLVKRFINKLTGGMLYKDSEIDALLEHSRRHIENQAGVSKQFYSSVTQKQADVLKASGIPIDEYADYILNTIADGEALRKVTEAVAFGDIELEDAAKIITEDWNSAKGHPEENRYVSEADAERYRYALNGLPTPMQQRIDRIMGRTKTLFHSARIALEDSYLDLFKAQESLENNLHIALPDRLNPYEAEQRVHGIIGDGIEKFENNTVIPLIKALDKPNLGIEKFEKFLKARHAREANDYIASINPDLPDGGSGMTTAEAANLLNQYRQEGTFDEMDRLREQFIAPMNSKILDMLAESGLISQDLKTHLETFYSYYVTLKGVPDEINATEDEYDPNLPAGQKYDQRARVMIERLGRTTEPKDVLANSFEMYQKALIRSERNKLTRMLADYVTTFADDNGVGRIITPSANEPITAKREKIKGVVEWVFNPNWYNSMESNKRQHVVIYRENGEQRFIWFDNERLAENWKGHYPSTNNMILNLLGKFNRFLATVNTSLNPEFILANLIKDLQTAGINLSAEQYEVVRKAVIKDVLTGKTVKGIYAALRGDYSTDYAKAFRDMSKYGGKMVFYGLKDVEAYAREIENMVKTAHKKGVFHDANVMLQKVGKVIEMANAIAENSTRLSVFHNLVQAGFTKEKAAFVARNITVNFTKGGELKGVLNTLYLFYGASVGGIARLLLAAKSKKVQKILGGIVAGQFALALINRIVGGDDDDGIPYYDKIPEWAKNHNLIVALPFTNGKFIKIPLPYGYNVFNVVGNSIYDVLFTDKKIGKSVGNLAVSTIESFNPLGGGNTLLSAISPTFARPLVDLSTNKDVFDRPIKPNQNPFDIPKPESELYWNSVSKPSKFVTDSLNEITGGNKLKPGVISISPEYLDYFVSYATGGVGMFMLRGVNLAETVLTGVPIEANDVPFIRRFYGDIPNYVYQEDYRTIKDAIILAKKQHDHFVSSGDTEAAEEVMREQGDLMQSYEQVKATDKELSALRKERVATQNNNTLDAANKYLILEQLNAREKAIITSFKEALNEM